jgi:hypothetical protein
MKIVSLEEYKKKKYPQYLTDEELDILRQIDEQKNITFSDEEILNGATIFPEFEGDTQHE